MSSPGRIAILINPNARRLRLRPGLTQALERRASRGATVAVSARASEVGEALDGLLDSHPDVLAIAGGDGTLSVVLQEGLRRQRSLPPLLPLRCGAVDGIAKMLRLRGGPLRILERVARLEREALAAHTRRVPTLRVTSSLQPRAAYGFTLAAGGLYDVIEAGYRRGEHWRHTALAAAGAIGQELRSPQARSAAVEAARLDGAALTAAPRQVWVSALPPWRPWGRRAPTRTARPTMHVVLSAQGLARALLATSPLPLGGDGVTADDARELLLDLSEGFALDGELFPAREPQSLCVRPGPVVMLLAV